MSDDQPTTPSRALFVALMERGGFRFAILAAALTILGYFVFSDQKVPAQAASVGAILLFGAIWIFYEALRQALNRCASLQSDIGFLKTQAVPATPRVLAVLPTETDMSRISLLLEPHPLFGQSMMVSMFYENASGFEIFLGLGIVVNIQANRKIYVEINEWVDGQDSVRRELWSTDAERLKRILIRPGGTTALESARCTMAFTPEIFDLLMTRGGNDTGF